MRNELHELNLLQAKTGGYCLLGGVWYISNGFRVVNGENLLEHVNVEYSNGQLSFDKLLNLEQGADTNTGFYYKGLLMGKPHEISLSGSDDTTIVMNTGYANNVKEVILNVRVESPSRVSYVQVHIMSDGTEFHAVTGRVTNHEFDTVSFVYDNAESLMTGVHVVNIEGNGEGTAMAYYVRAEIVNNV